jgi:hypothetical protein
MTVLVWVLRGLLLGALLPSVFPVEIVVKTTLASPLAFALVLLALAVLALSVVLALAAGVFGSVLDLLIVLGAIGLAWKWPRGVGATFVDRLRLAQRGLRNVVRSHLKRCSPTDVALCPALVLLAFVLSLAAGIAYLVITVAIISLGVALMVKWPSGASVSFSTKLRIALRALWKEITGRLR